MNSFNSNMPEWCIDNETNTPRKTWLEDLSEVPCDWALLCVNDKKQPYNPATGELQTRWADGAGLDASEIQELSPHAVGVLLGEKSGGLMAIDFDGPGSEEKFQEVF